MGTHSRNPVVNFVLSFAVSLIAIVVIVSVLVDLKVFQRFWKWMNG